VLANTKVAIGVQLGAFPTPPNKPQSIPLFVLNLASESPNASCSANLQFSYTANRTVVFSGANWARLNGTTSTEATIFPGDRIVLVVKPMLFGLDKQTFPQNLFELYRSSPNLNSEMNSSKPTSSWIMWDSLYTRVYLGCAEPLVPSITNLENSAIIQSIYIQKGQHGAKGEPSLGQNLIPDGGAESDQVDNYWRSNPKSNEANSTYIFSTNSSSGRNSSRAFNITFTGKAPTAYPEVVGILQVDLQPALFPLEAYA